MQTQETVSSNKTKPVAVRPAASEAAEAGLPAGEAEQRSKVRIRPMAVLVVLLLATAAAGGLLLFRNLLKREPSVILMDTTAPTGVYDEENRQAGISNSKELYKVLSERLLPARTLYPVALSAGWGREEDVCSLRPDLVIVHRAALFHSYNAEFNFRPTNQFATAIGDPRWWYLYNLVGEDRLISLMGYIGSQVPQCKFLVYSRGVDTNWLSDEFRTNQWVGRKVEARFPKLKGRVFTMVVPNSYMGTFRDPKTAEALCNQVKAILRLPDKRTKAPDRSATNQPVREG